MSPQHGHTPRKPATKQPHLQKKMRKQKTAALGRKSKKADRGKGR